MNRVFGARDKTGRARLGFWGGFQVVSRVPVMFKTVPTTLALPQNTADLHGTPHFIAAGTPR
jgi:amino acid transporter